jgi:hypothetical protein
MMVDVISYRCSIQWRLSSHGLAIASMSLVCGPTSSGVAMMDVSCGVRRGEGIKQQRHKKKEFRQTVGRVYLIINTFLL